MTLKLLALLTAASLTAVALLTGCGSSSKPAYCTQVTNFEKSVQELEKVEFSPTNVSGISTAMQKVGTSAKEMVSAVKTEFAPQISAAKSSLASLEETLKQVASAPSASTLSHAVTVVPTEVESLKKATAEIKEVAKSKCG